jgi:hypothetical protein
MALDNPTRVMSWAELSLSFDSVRGMSCSLLVSLSWLLPLFHYS